MQVRQSVHYGGRYPIRSDRIPPVTLRHSHWRERDNQSWIIAKVESYPAEKNSKAFDVNGMFECCGFALIGNQGRIEDIKDINVGPEGMYETTKQHMCGPLFDKI